ncbi:MAG: CNNM domain-containing protein [Alphaproteobacteria bacterium]|nr:CNNM domain-containing protein [Alphaproteobacteria bacterium]|tara:strand:+ start:2363 stop:3598 length:1236 start_codon:yes stop_codon:yes gene_type:complete
MIIEIIGIFFLLLLSGFFSSSETAITRISDVKIYQWSENKSSRYKRARELMKSREKIIGILLLGNNIVNILASALATSILIGLFGDKGIIYATLIMTALIFIFSEVLPKTYAIREPEKLVLYASPIIKIFTIILSPINFLVQRLVSSILNLANKETKNNDWRQNLRGAILLANNKGDVRKRDRIMLESILDLHEVKVSEIMTHRKNIEGININENIDMIIDLSLKSRFTRLPLWKENADNIIGTLHIKDLLRAKNSNNSIEINEIMQKPQFISENTSLSEQLNNFKKETIQMAFVIDEYGDLQGLITLEDILEEIVGEIFDEFDKQITGPEILEDKSVIVDGAMTIRDLNKLMDWKLEDEEASTIAGLVIDVAQKLPSINETIKINNFNFTILERQRTRITKINIKPITTD